MHNMYANCVLRNEPSRKSKRRESAIVSTTTSSAVVSCSHCKPSGHRVQNCFARQKSMKNHLPLRARTLDVACITPIVTKTASAWFERSVKTAVAVASATVNQKVYTASPTVLTRTPPSLPVQQLMVKTYSPALSAPRATTTATAMANSFHVYDYWRVTNPSRRHRLLVHCSVVKQLEH